MNQWQSLAEALNRTMAAHTPEWTNFNDSDPGLTFLEVMAFLAENLQFQGGNLERGSAAVARVIAGLERAGAIEVETSVALIERWSGTKRPNYFPGKVLTDRDLTEEQNYFLEKHRRHLRTLHGTGIVHGLEVSIDEQTATVTIEPGLAIDARGREIQLNDKATVQVSSNTLSPSLVVVEYAERFVDPVAVAIAEVETTKPTRIEEGCQIALADEGSKSGVAVARLIKDQNAWRVDPSFAAPRAH